MFFNINNNLSFETFESKKKAYSDLNKLKQFACIIIDGNQSFDILKNGFSPELEQLVKNMYIPNKELEVLFSSTVLNF